MRTARHAAAVLVRPDPELCRHAWGVVDRLGNLHQCSLCGVFGYGRWQGSKIVPYGCSTTSCRRLGTCRLPGRNHRGGFQFACAQHTHAASQGP